ncbi:restriction endonuclease [Gottfriedia acidiceleris]|uniref:restriction endonuclease n=1 Tax=Gottfriedia acidiceleris TaxID=371036 RepID=UPI002FFF1688
MQSVPIIAVAVIIMVAISFFSYIYKEMEIKSELKALEEKLSGAGIYEIDRMNGYEFEHYLELLFNNNGIPALRTPSSGDFGADLVLEGNERVVVQAKRYKNKVGIKAVQEINSAKSYYNAHEAWVITNNFFTPQAIKLAEATGVKLIDRNELANLILKFKKTDEVSNWR